jgi:hypothetical protein
MPTLTPFSLTNASQRTTNGSTKISILNEYVLSVHRGSSVTRCSRHEPVNWPLQWPIGLNELAAGLISPIDYVMMDWDHSVMNDNN